MMKTPRLKEIKYWRVIKPPTLKQYLHRRNVAAVMASLEGETGVSINPENRQPIPRAALKTQQLLKGVTAEKVAELHPDWVEDWRKEYGG